MSLTLSLTGSQNLLSSRDSPQTTDTLSPGHGQLVVALTQMSEDMGHQMAFQVSIGPSLFRATKHSPAVIAGSLHAPFRYSSDNPKFCPAQ